ncbi:MAG: glycoside hydrolase family 9 protein [Ruminococcus sp.]|nr:glycoside hydrolase family 9 protein [Ruminococcus sp.]MDE6784637.1 glycoside hydrolase family 9 protein [Ruminococcus sp.]
MHKKISKAFAGSLMSAAMLASAVTGVLAPMSAFAGEQLGQNDFEEGAGLPWHTCESQPAKQTFDISGGTYNVTIVNNDGPESRWDLQFRHRGLKISAGHTYTVKWEVEASTSGEMYTKIGDYSGKIEVWHNNAADFGSGWNCVPIKQGKNTFECTFTADQTVEVAEWAFHYGGKGMHQPVDCFPNGTVLKFDNLSLVDSSSENDWDMTNEYGVVRARTNVRTNQIGYYPFLEKNASYCTDAQEPLEFEIRDASGSVVYTGMTSGGFEDPDSGVGETVENKYGLKKKDSGKYVHKIDFTDFQTPGVYTLFVKDTTGVSGTVSGLLEGAYDTKLEGEDLMWTNPKSKLTYKMNTSYEFRIDENIYDDGLVANSLNYFYQNRSGIDIESKYITSGDASTLAHQAGHAGSDKAAVQSGWTKFYDGDFADGDTSYSIDGVGGWYDAGDHGKYVVNGGVSVWTLQNTYELSKKLGTDAKWTGDLVKIPESGDKNPDILDEARYELEWMMKMIVKSSDPYWGKDYENFVYHKLHDHKWTGLATKAWDYEEEWGTKRLVKPPTYAATLNFVACAAQAARLWKGIDDTFADKCLELAKTSYEAVKAKEKDWKVEAGVYKKRESTSDSYSNGDPLFAPDDQAIGGGPYGDNYVQDDFYWAGCELLATTGDSKYYDDVKAYKNNNDSTGMDKAFSLTSNLGGGENKGSFSSFNWGCTSGLGTLTLYLNPQVIPNDIATVESSIAAAADAYIDCMHEDTNGMGIPYRGSVFTDPNNIGVDENGNPIEVEGYEWGSNSFVINNAIVMAYAYDSTKKIKYLDGAAEAMDYIFGRNGNAFSYVSGYGSHSMAHPHHRFWCNDVDPAFPMAPAGVLSGGPGAGLQDPYVGGLGYIRGTVASQKCYVDSAEAWSVNEVTINWNAPLVAMSSYMSDVASALTDRADGNVDPPKPPVSDNPSEATLWGDANVDGTVTVADATLILQYLGNKDKYKIEPQGLANADVVDNGGGLSAVDALSIQMWDAGLFDASKWPMTTDEHNKLAAQ